MRHVLALSVLVVCFVAQAGAGMPGSDGFTIYGFELPQLHAGEYLLSARGTISSTDVEIDAADPDYDYSTTSGLTCYDVRSVYAATDQILIRFGLTYYPGQTVDEVDQLHMGSAVQAYKLEQDATLKPDIGLVFRPSRVLEFYGTWSREASHRDFSEEYTYRGSDQETSNFRFGVNYFGSF